MPKETLDFTVQILKMTSDILKQILVEYLNSDMPKKREISYSNLRKNGKLDNIEITENNIADFREVARKYGMQFALKRDSSTTPQTYHIFFTGQDSDVFKRAFSEYAGIKQKEIKQAVITTEQIKNNAKIISVKQAEKDAERNMQLEIGGR